MNLMEAKAKLADQSCESGECIENDLAYQSKELHLHSTDKILTKFPCVHAGAC